MTNKKQMLTRGFGKRSLSVLLAMLMLLSTFAVMLTATSLTVNAAISYWLVAGNFNNWSTTENEMYKINGASGTVTIPITASSITFKMVAHENNNDIWNGNSTGTLSSGSETQLIWESNGVSSKDITMSLPANTESVTFTIDVRNGNNYLKATANIAAPKPTHPVPTIGNTTFNAPVNESNPANTNKDKIFWAKATYYDYLSDAEMASDGGWLYPDHVGTRNSGFNQNNGNIDEWYPFNFFNRDIVKPLADTTTWQTPLYFGNFCNTYDAYDTAHHPGVPNGYIDATSSAYVSKFNYAANNSNGVYDMYTSVQGLMGSTLQNGQLQTPNGSLAPYFDAATLTKNKYGRVVESAFPFRKTVVQEPGKKEYTRYEFDSTDATDNVYFTWKTENDRSEPIAVNYGAGTAYGVKDGLMDFMGETPGYGIFPFNNANTTAANTYKGTKTYTNEKLDYGFGIRMDMKFRIPKDTEVKFDFSGDDDLWMYITDEAGNSQLILDMGGSHKMSEGEVNFNTGKATVKKVEQGGTNRDIWVVERSNWNNNIAIWAWNNGSEGEWFVADTLYKNQHRFKEDLIGSKGGKLGSKTNFIITRGIDNWNGQSPEFNMSDCAGKCIHTDTWKTDTEDVKIGGPNDKAEYNFGAATQSYAMTDVATTSFNIDPNKTYTMTIFYMERGLLESNCKMGFTMTPLGNNFIVTETIDTANVNKGIQDAVRQRTSFDFSYEGTKTGDSKINGQFTLKDVGEYPEEGRIEIPDTEIGINYDITVTQSANQNSDGDYLEYETTWDYWDNVNGNQLSKIQGSSTTGQNSSTSTGAHTMIDPATGDPYDYAELQVNFRNTPKVTSVNITKDVYDEDGNNVNDDYKDVTFGATVYLQFGSTMAPTAFDLETTNGDYIYGGRVELQAGKTITIPNVPVGTHVTVEEDKKDGYKDPKYSPEVLVAGTDGTLTVNNYPVIDPVTGEIKTQKYITQQSAGSKGLYESGELFTFNVEGLGKETLEDGKTSVSVKGMDKELYETDANGVVTFENDKEDEDDDFLKFKKVGTYLFKVYETKVAHTDIELDDTVYLARFDVTMEDGKLKLEGPVYYEYDGKPITASTFDATKKVPSIEFNNPAKPGSVTVNKTDGAGDALEGVTFSIYKVDGNNGAIIENNKVAEAKTEKTIDEDGNEIAICKFENLDIFKKKDNGKYAANPEYQWYVLLETEAANGYVKSTEAIAYFTLPMTGADGKLKYDITFDYVNGAIKNPSTAGPGTFGLKITGLAIILFATALLTYYVLRNKRRLYQLIATIK